MVESDDKTRALVDAAVNGDAAAFDKLALEHYAPLERYLKRQLLNNGKVEVADVMQDAFARAFVSLSQFSGASKSDFSAWLRGIARNQSVDRMRHATRKKRGGDFQRVEPKGTDSKIYNLAMMLVDENETPSQVVAVDEAVGAMGEAIERLPDQQRIAIRLRFIDGLSLEEIAEATNQTVAAVRGLIFRAKKRLHDDMGATTRWFGQA